MIPTPGPEGADFSLTAVTSLPQDVDSDLKEMKKPKEVLDKQTVSISENRAVFISGRRGKSTRLRHVLY